MMSRMMRMMRYVRWLVEVEVVGACHADSVSEHHLSHSSALCCQMEHLFVVVVL
jgi:hypothetical protein